MKGEGTQEERTEMNAKRRKWSQDVTYESIN